MKLLKKYPKAAAAVLGAVLLLGLFVWYERSRVLSDTTEMHLPNESRSGGVCTDTFYSDQLTDKELKIYQMMTARLGQMEGGVVIFEEPLTGMEYLRITAAIEYENNYFYGFYEIPMSKDNIYLKYQSSDLTKIREPEIAKAILFLSCAEGINTPGEYGEDGTVLNLDQVAEGLSVNDKDKEQQVLEQISRLEQELTEIVEGIPAEAGEKDTLDYFMDWMGEHLEYYDQLGTDAFSFTTMDEVFEQAYKNSHDACILTGKATMLGYTKLLSTLCNRSGISAHVVLGSWGDKQEGYTMSAVRIANETIYVDASGVKASKLGGERYLNEKEAFAHMVPTDYFVYE